MQVLNSREPAVIDSNTQWVTAMRKHNVGAGEYLAPGEKAEGITRTLELLRGVRLLQFQGLRPGAFGGFGDREKDAWMDRQIHTILDVDSRWCCRHAAPSVALLK